ncbi:MAG: sigma-70 family RNA polymerase sigma factor [Candidatus Omnitrophota bacterium]|nr:sigma-70 family RNA polymerase sigma factor [Candidatus Omnitrophota bacterium]
MNDSKIIKRCLKNDKKAWNVFIQKYSRLVYWAIRKRLATGGFRYDETDIDDIFQEVFLTIFKGEKLRQLKDFKFMPGWLAMVTSNKTVDFMRNKVRLEQNLVFDVPVFRDYTFEQNLFNRDMFFVTQEVIKALSGKERIIISLNLLQERTHKEIAGIVGISINTVSTVISRAKEKIKKELEKRGLGDSF